jgi:hypothetical protein
VARPFPDSQLQRAVTRPEPQATFEDTGMGECPIVSDLALRRRRWLAPRQQDRKQSQPRSRPGARGAARGVGRARRLPPAARDSCGLPTSARSQPRGGRRVSRGAQPGSDRRQASLPDQTAGRGQSESRPSRGRTRTGHVASSTGDALSLERSQRSATAPTHFPIVADRVVTAPLLLHHSAKSKEKSHVATGKIASRLEPRGRGSVGYEHGLAASASGGRAQARLRHHLAAGLPGISRAQR